MYNKIEAKEKRERIKNIKKENGICFNCTNKNNLRTNYCDNCIYKKKTQQKQKRESRTKEEIQKEKEDRKIYRDKNKENIKESRKQNQKKYLETSKNRKERLKSSGLCVNCGLYKSCGNITFCETCCYKKSSYEYLNRSDRYKEIKDIYIKQNGLCGESKIKLIFGIDASIDHIKPVSKFPELKYDINNLRIVHKNINLMKRQIDVDNFTYILKTLVKMRKEKIQ